jgi:DNA-binding MarR family transcriptional regulator
MMTPSDYSNLLNNKVLKERSRLLIVSFLMASETNSATFMALQKSLNLTRGNLSIQIKNLAQANYITIKKEFKHNKPQTTLSITDEGIIALKKYLKEMEEIIRSSYNT